MGASALGYVSAFATLFCWTITVFIMSKLSRLSSPAAVNKALLFFSFLVLGVLVCVVDGINPLELLSRPASSQWYWLGASGIIGKTLGDYSGLACLRILGAYRRSMFTTLTPGFTWIFGVYLLGERLNTWAVVGMILTITSIILLLSSQVEQEEVRAEKFGRMSHGALFGISAAALTALAFVFSKIAFEDNADQISEFHATWIRVAVAFAALWITDALQDKNVNFLREFINDGNKLRLILLGTIFGNVAGLSLSLIAILRMKVSVAYTIFAFVPVAVFLVSALLFTKRARLISALWILLAISGTLIMIWRNNF